MTLSKKEIFNVLFVDDEENVLRSMRRLFMDVDGINILTAPSGKEGLGMMKNTEVAVIVSDQRMPEMSGPEFLEKARKMQPESVRIVLTGYADINAAMDAVNKGGASKYITKPWGDNDLMLTVLNSVETYNLKKENKRLTELTRKQNEELKKWSSELEFYVQQQTIDLTRQNKELGRLNERLNRNIKDFISSFSNLIELRDKSVSNHSNSVAAISREMSIKMGMNSSEIETITIAAQLHDIGKIGIADVVLLKTPAEMSPDELAEYKKHPVRGQSAIDSVEDLRGAGILIRHHHEWFNGKGFPEGIKEKEIPIGSRIIAIADQFDRLIHGVYQIHDVQSVLNKIKASLGTQFDPELFKFLIDAVKERFASISEKIDLKTRIEVELSINDIMPGMTVSRNIRSGTGFLLLSEGTVLNNKNIAALKRGYHIDPVKTGIFVWVKRK
jgi:response regulator RpfG family c-di-GMP phosphodiesterase